MAARKQSNLTIDEAFQRFIGRKKAGHMPLASSSTKLDLQFCRRKGSLMHRIILPYRRKNVSPLR